MKSLGRVIALALCFSMLAVMACKKDNKRVLYVDSYHEGYAWSDGITRGIKSILVPAGKELKIIRMDTKRNASEEFKKEAALKAKQVIEEYKPAVVIASDDNASKYLIEPYFKGKDVAFVFCGVNWDASIYGFPTNNVTGMVEVTLVPELISYLKEYAKGDKMAYFAADDLTGRKEVENYRKKFSLKFDEFFAKDWAEYKEMFKKIQSEYSYVIMGNNAAIKDWPDDAKKFFLENTKIPTGAVYDWMKDYALISMTVVAEEQGEYAAQTALKIMSGTPVKDIPVAQNKKGNLFVNLSLAKKMNVVFSRSTLANAEKVE